MKKNIFFVVGVIAGLLVFVSGGNISAHVVVQPSQVVAAERTTFAVSVPNEHDTPVVAVRLIIPEGLSSVRPFVKPGWNVEVIKSGDDEDAPATEIIWTSTGGEVPVDLKDEFLFSAKAPSDPGELQWKAYETYADGMVVSWDQVPSETEGNKPYSVTRVLAEPEAATMIVNAERAAKNAKTTANRALFLGSAGVIIGIIGVAAATRKK